MTVTGPLVARRERTGNDIAEVRSPFDHRVVARVGLAGPPEADEAAEAARAAFEPLSRTPTFERRDVLEATSRALLERLDELADIICDEAGKPITLARAEVRRAAQTFHIAAGEAERLGGELLPIDLSAATAGYHCLVRRVPKGPVLAIGPFNFPLNLLAHKIAPALAVGAPVVVKPPPQAPSAALVLGRILASVAPDTWPDGFLSVLPCENDVAESLVRDERFAVLSFTGSDTVGWRLKSIAGKKSVLLELGGDAAAIVCDDADLELAAKKLAWGSAAYAGQVCIAVQRVFAHPTVRDELQQRLADATKSLVSGSPSDPNVVSGPVIDDRAAERIEAALAESGTVVVGATRQGRMLTPSLVADPDEQGVLGSRELFGPGCALWTAGSFEEALARVNASRFGLQASLWTRDMRRVFQAHEALRVGGLIVNDVPTLRVDNYPYGGTKDSGLGREGGRTGVEELTEPRVLVVNPR